MMRVVDRTACYSSTITLFRVFIFSLAKCCAGAMAGLNDGQGQRGRHGFLPTPESSPERPQTTQRHHENPASIRDNLIRLTDDPGSDPRPYILSLHGRSELHERVASFGVVNGAHTIPAGSEMEDYLSSFALVFLERTTAYMSPLSCWLEMLDNRVTPFTSHSTSAFEKRAIGNLPLSWRAS